MHAIHIHTKQDSSLKPTEDPHVQPHTQTPTLNTPPPQPPHASPTPSPSPPQTQSPCPPQIFDQPGTTNTHTHQSPVINGIIPFSPSQLSDTLGSLRTNRLADPDQQHALCDHAIRIVQVHDAETRLQAVEAETRPSGEVVA